MRTVKRTPSHNDSSHDYVLLERRRPSEVRTEEHHRFRRQRATRLAVPCTKVITKVTASQPAASQPVSSAWPWAVARGAFLLARTSTSPARRLYQPSPAGGASSGCSLTCPGWKERTSWSITSPAPRDALPLGYKPGLRAHDRAELAQRFGGGGAGGLD